MNYRLFKIVRIASWFNFYWFLRLIKTEDPSIFRKFFSGAQFTLQVLVQCFKKTLGCKVMLFF